MRGFKRLTAVILIVILSISLAGCDSSMDLETTSDIAISESASNEITRARETKKESAPSKKVVAAKNKAETKKVVIEKEHSETKKQVNKNKVKVKYASSKLKLSQIPNYKAVNAPYVRINNNKPTFKNSEIKKASFESYSKLDSIGRCGVAVASVSRDTMPRSKRGSISEVHPSGWHSYRYSSVEGQSLYNRCHLIGFQLTGENANERNLITGTRYLNTEGMLPFENQVADYVKSTNNHVMYRVTPIYSGNELVVRGVQMEGYSVEDKGRGVCFNVYCYNVQPGIKINYANGTSSGKGLISYSWKSGRTSNSKGINKSNNAAKNSVNNSAKNKSGTYILSLGTKKFHRSNCPSVKQILAKNKGTFNGSRKTLIDQGYAPCKNCNP